MDRAVFDRMAEDDATHWWYVARRRILSDLIARETKLPDNAQILEIGCGTGHNFPMLGHFGHVDAIEVDAPARAIAAERLGRRVGDAPLPGLPGVPEAHYDLIALLDVLEHVAEDRESLASIATRLRPGGRILVTVPANRWMWSAHDIVHHHHRRYTTATLRRVISDAGLSIRLMSHFNSLLFPVAAAARLAGRLLRRGQADDAMPPAPVNAMLRSVFGLERHLVGRVPLPFGVSIVALIERPGR